MHKYHNQNNYDQDYDKIKNLEVDINCGVCGERKFFLKEGFYYCDECGIKLEHVVAIEVQNEDFASAKYCKVQKISGPQIEKPKLTSWECYNYILCGLTDQLINLGVDSQLKQVSLQLWAAYLRKMEVAFFNMKEADIPRLSVKYFRKDAAILYNHNRNKPLRLRKKVNQKSYSTKEKKREWRKNKKNLDRSEYEDISKSQTNLISCTENSFLSSSTDATTQAIQLQFSTHARRQLKRTMQRSHIRKHQQDFYNELKCHKIIKLRESERSIEILSIRHLFVILIVALNLIQDDIQFSDFVRFVAEGHISISDPITFFPENVAPFYKELLNDIQFHNFQYYKPKTLRFHAVNFCKFLGIEEMVMPNLTKLVDRYVSELCLPVEIVNFVKRLINLYPPEMRFTSNNFLCYEARIMAYILFALKLLFGLDECKEKYISRSSKEVNVLFDSSEHIDKSEKLFVWDEWINYIEMRKVIVSQYHSEANRKYKQTENISQYFKHCSKDFLPSFTPCSSYMEEILRMKDERFFIIPDYMYIDHRLRKLEPFLNHKKLQENLSKFKVNLKVTKRACSRKASFLGIFHPVFAPEKGVKKAFQNIDKEDWIQSCSKSACDNLLYKTVYDFYCDSILRNLKKERKEKNADQWVQIFNFLKNDSKYGFRSYNPISNNIDNVSESTLNLPRHTLDSNYFFDDMSNEILNVDTENKTTLEIVVSNLDYWILLGEVNKFSNLDKSFLKEKLPKSFFWLLELCSKIIEVDWIIVYEQLLVIETMFTFGIEPLKKFHSCIKYKSMNPNKDLNNLINHFRHKW